MRPYRGLTKEGKWVYGWYSESWAPSLGYRSKGSFIRFLDDDDNYQEVEVIPETVGQDTGLKDKNGMELDWWEGDIFDDAGVLKVIVKDKGCFWFENIKSKRRIPCYQVAEASGEWVDDIKKQGSIHTYPELIQAVSNTEQER